MEIQDRIKQRREELGLSIRELADKLNVAPSTVLRYESSAIKNMGIDKIELLSSVLQCTPAFLMGWNQSATHEIDSIYIQLDERDQEAVLSMARSLLQADRYQQKKGGSHSA